MTIVGSVFCGFATIFVGVYLLNTPAGRSGGASTPLAGTPSTLAFTSLPSNATTASSTSTLGHSNVNLSVNIMHPPRPPGFRRPSPLPTATSSETMGAAAGLLAAAVGGLDGVAIARSSFEANSFEDRGIWSDLYKNVDDNEDETEETDAAVLDYGDIIENEEDAVYELGVSRGSSTHPNRVQGVVGDHLTQNKMTLIERAHGRTFSTSSSESYASSCTSAESSGPLLAPLHTP